MHLVFNQVTVLQSHYFSGDIGTNVRETLENLFSFIQIQFDPRFTGSVLRAENWISFLSIHILSKFKRILYTVVDIL